MKAALPFFFAAVALFLAAAAPANLQPPPDQKLLLQLHGKGDQIYVCKGADSGFAWTLKAPDARLLGSGGDLAGRHFAGPTWEAKDGSRVTGKAIANAPSPDSRSIPWLLVTAVGHEGNGAMSNVLSIQRLNTEGGKAPDEGCDGGHAGIEIRVPYQADYLFYGRE
jgi:hypothetical protein